VDFYSVALHEVGHGLGLDHTDVPFSNIMTTFFRGEKLTASQDDMNGLGATYGYDPTQGYNSLVRTLPSFTMGFGNQYDYFVNNPTNSGSTFHYYIDAGNITITGATTVQQGTEFHMSGGLWNTNTLLVGLTNNSRGLFEISAGTFTANGVSINTGGTMNITGGLFQTGSLTIAAAGAFSWSGGTVSLTGPAVLSGPTSLTVPAGGTLLTAGVLNLTTLTTNGVTKFVGSGTSKITNFNIGGSTGAWTGKVDLTSSSLIVQTSSNKATVLATLADQIVSGRNGGTWNGNGLTSSSIASLQNTTLALVDNGDLGLGTFNGVAVTGNSLIVTRALLGDADLSNVVDAGDFDIWYKHVGVFTSSYAAGDLDLSGVVDAADFDVWYKHVGLVGLSLTAADSVGVVPEPASLALLAIPVLGIAIRQWPRGRRRSG
jgi:hypothetical protein